MLIFLLIFKKPLSICSDGRPKVIPPQSRKADVCLVNGMNSVAAVVFNNMIIEEPYLCAHTIMAAQTCKTGCVSHFSVLECPVAGPHKGYYYSGRSSPFRDDTVQNKARYEGDGIIKYIEGYDKASCSSCT